MWFRSESHISVTKALLISDLNLTSLFTGYLS
ncbi:hypothetical protein AAZX31_16G034500 [Glycine max]